MKTDPLDETLGVKESRKPRMSRATRVATGHVAAQAQQVVKAAERPMLNFLFSLIRVPISGVVLLWSYSKLEVGLKGHDWWLSGAGVIGCVLAAWIIVPQRTKDGVAFIVGLIGDGAAALGKVRDALKGILPTNPPPPPTDGNP